MNPYTQRTLPPSSQQQRPIQPAPQIVKADTPVPPGYVKLLSPNGVYRLESVETGSINFPFAEPHLAPTIILRNHDFDIMKLQGYHNDISNQIAHLTTMITRNAGTINNSNSDSIIDNNVDGSGEGELEEHEIVFDEAVIHKITENQTFIANTVSHIMQNTNLAELVTEVNAVKTENRELRSILNSQHEMMNGMNALLFTLLNKMHTPRDDDDNVQSHYADVSVSTKDTLILEQHDHENKTKMEDASKDLEQTTIVMETANAGEVVSDASESVEAVQALSDEVASLPPIPE